MSHVLITGVPIPPGSTLAPERKEITAFVDKSNIEQFSLYVQAVNYLMTSPDLPESALSSWFQVSGVHAEPLVEWNGVPKDDWFCQHGTEHFPTWHRPYIATIEQFIQDRALIIAKQYTKDTSVWLNAARDLRQPYWDWASPTPHLPPSIVIDQNITQVEIKSAPNGDAKRVPNPFITYRFRSQDHPNPGGTSARNQTWRTNPFAVNTRFLNARKTEIEKLMTINNWSQFSNHSVPQAPGNRSLEGSHDEVHNTIGGFMQDPATAAFDPIFWLHHTNVDRILHFWYQKWKKGPSQPGAEQIPFWQTQTKKWPSGGPTLDPVNLGYSYPTTGSRAGATPRLHSDEWDLQIESKKHEVGGSYIIYFFAGSIPGYGDWDHAPHLLGKFSVFANRDIEHCSNCRQHADSSIHGALDITDALVELEHDIGDKGHIVDYLKGNLKVATKSLHNDAPAELPSLKYKLVHVPLLGFSRGEPSSDIPYLPYPNTGDSTEYEI